MFDSDNTIDAQNRPFWVKLTAYDGSKYYTWTEQRYTLTGTFVNQEGGRSGTASRNPVFERNGFVIPTSPPSYVEARRAYFDATKDWVYVCGYEVGSGSGTTLSGSGCCQSPVYLSGSGPEFLSGAGETFDAGSFLTMLLGSVLNLYGTILFKPGSVIGWPFYDHLDVVTDVCPVKSGPNVVDILVEYTRLYLPPYLKKPGLVGCITSPAGCCDSGSGSGSGSGPPDPCVTECEQCPSGAPLRWVFSTTGFTGAKFTFNGEWILDWASNCAWDVNAGGVTWTLQFSSGVGWILSGVSDDFEQRVYYTLDAGNFACTGGNTLMIDADFTTGTGDVEDSITMSPVDNDCPTDPPITVACCPGPVPQSLFATFNSSCGQINGISVPLNYIGAPGGVHQWGTAPNSYEPVSGDVSLYGDSPLTLSCDLGGAWNFGPGSGTTQCLNPIATFSSAPCGSSGNTYVVFSTTIQGTSGCSTCVAGTVVTITITG